MPAKKTIQGPLGIMQVYGSTWDWNKFWNEKWQNKDIGFHQAEVNPKLTRWLRDRKGHTIFVPLCGKSRDMSFMIQCGNQVVGVELSRDKILHQSVGGNISSPPGSTANSFGASPSY